MILVLEVFICTISKTGGSAHLINFDGSDTVVASKLVEIIQY
jgi:hypothetical protein